MTFPDPFAPLRDWRTSLYRGEALAINQFLDGIDSGLLQGWVRDSAFEGTRDRPDRVRCYLFNRPSDASVRVWLQVVTPTRVRGGAVQLLRQPPSGDAKRVGELVESFANSCVLPAASAAGVLHTHPSFGPQSAVTLTTEMLFTRLADTADGKWPLDGPAKQLWDELVSTCLNEHVAIDRADFEHWLLESGWEPTATTLIASGFFADSEWLAERLGVSTP